MSQAGYMVKPKIIVVRKYASSKNHLPYQSIPTLEFVTLQAVTDFILRYLRAFLEQMIKA